ncbi:MAG: hypothetical protein J6T86_01330 [Bacteroidales bacterium]|nr:hypothetical protein [Bacteroidales bacterium]
MSTLLIDAGATKTAFAVLGHTELLHRSSTAGINVNYTPEADIRSCFTQFASQCPDFAQIDKVEYYGAGCATTANQQKMRLILQDYFPNAHLIVDTDLMVVCLALSTGRQSIIGILGTGAATCLFDGHEITLRPPSLGYMLGDEGSGTNLGKRLLTHYLNGDLPKELSQQLEAQQHLTFQSTIHRLYSEPKPNQFMASFSPFIHEHLSHPFIDEMVTGAFRDFFAKQRKHFSSGIPWQLSGSIAYFYEELVRKAAIAEQCIVEDIVQEPMERLIAERTQRHQDFNK